MGLVHNEHRILRMILGQQTRFKISLGWRFDVPQWWEITPLTDDA